MVRVLFVNGGPMNRGGIESFMMNYLRHIDMMRIHIDFAVKGPEKGEYDDEILNKGCVIYRLPLRSKHPVEYKRKLEEILRKNKYDIVHSHADAISCWILKIAKSCGVPIRIAHSHNTKHLTKNPIKIIINEYARKRINYYANYRFACSQEAGKWLFGDERYIVVNNAIEYNKYKFDKVYRDVIRAQYAIKEDDILLGHVGRFDTQKNHVFLIDLFYELSKNNSKYKLMLIGDGWKIDEIRERVNNYNISDNVIFAGLQSETYKYYSAFDLFVFPSLFEGLAFTLIEAQANGLFCICSIGISKECKLTDSDNVFFVPLDIKKWIDLIIKLEVPERYNCEKDIIEKGYDIIEESKKLEEYYIEITRDICV